MKQCCFFTEGKNDHEFLVVGGIWGVVTGGTGPRPCLAPDGGNTVGGGGDGEGTPTTSPAPVIKIYILYYSRVHKSPDSFFSKILEKPSRVQKKMIPHIKGLDFSQR